MDITIVVNKQSEALEDERWLTTAFTEGFGVKATGPNKDKAIRNLHAKLKLMNRFSRIARSTLEVNRLGFHTVKIKTKHEN